MLEQSEKWGLVLLLVGFVAAVLGIGNLVSKEGWREIGVIFTAIWLGAHYGAYRLYILPQVQSYRAQKWLFGQSQAETRSGQETRKSTLSKQHSQGATPQVRQSKSTLPMVTFLSPN